MPARIPLDVDLEDKLLYGLTPTRLAYLVIALLAPFSTWSSPCASAPIRAGVAVAWVVIGALAAWGRWRGRPADRWLIDIVGFALSTFRVRWHPPPSVRRRLRSARLCASRRARRQ